MDASSPLRFSQPSSCLHKIFTPCSLLKLLFLAKYAIISAVATFIIRGTGTRFWAYSLWCIALLLLVLSWRNGGWQETVWVTPIVLAVAAVGYLMFWSPRLEVSESGVHIVNLLRHARISWNDIERIESRYGLYIYAHSLPKKVGVWAVPSRASIFNSSSFSSSSESNAKKQHFSAFNWTQTSGKIFEIQPLVDVAAALSREQTRQLAASRDASENPSAPTESTQSFYLPHLLILAATALLIAYAFIR